MSISLVAFLGNPGRLYAETRHNLAWRLADALAARERLAWKKHPAFEADVARWETAPGGPVQLAKPLTFMNESGRAVRALAAYSKRPVSSIAVVYDDVAIDLGLVKISTRGSAGGHNGVASLLQFVGDDFIRLRLGVGPKQPAQMDLKDFVLGKFTPEQRIIVEQSLPHYLSGLDLLLDSGPDRAMNSLNRRAHEPEQT